MTPHDGYQIVLTADRTLIAGYRLLFDGMLAASQTTTTPKPIMDALLMPKAPVRDGRALLASLGLRRIEAALLADGFTPQQVAVVAPDDLASAIGPATRLIAVSAGEPTGRGMNSSTMTGVAGGRIYPEHMFRKLMRDIRHLVATRAPQAKVAMGGAGAWQFAIDDAARRDFGIDFVVSGYVEANIAALFRTMVTGGDLPIYLPGQAPAPETIPPIHGAATMGAVEISRGCGLGCGFCTIAQTTMLHLPVETIEQDVRTNVAAGMRNIAMLSEDFFRYGARGVRPNPSALLQMLQRVRQIDGLGMIQIDHCNVISIAQWSDEELREARALLVGATGCEYPWVNVGIETAAGDLLRANGGAPKMGVCRPEDWSALCTEQIRRLNTAGFFPLTSLVLKMDGETPEHIRQTYEWVRSLEHDRVSIFPMLVAPIDGSIAPTRTDLSRDHWRLIRACYRYNFRWVPRMYWDNQKAAGVGLARRLLIQCMGWGQVAQWSGLFAFHTARARG